MDSYDLFGEDGAGMLEGLSDLGGDHFEPAVTGARDAAPSYAQPTYTQENPLQKLVSFGGTDFSHMDPNAQNMYAQGYGTERPMGPPGGPYQHQRQLVRPSVSQTTPTGQYPYQPDNMYSMPDHQLSMGDAAGMQSWGQHSGYPLHRYGQMSSYRQQPMASYSHQQEQKHQFSPTQHPIMQQPHQTAYSMQQRHTPHYPQSTAYSATAGQAYSGYMHQRLPHHHQYPQTHHQIDMGVSQTQQYNHMSHAAQALSTHAVQHATATSGHMSQPHATSQSHSTPTQQTAQNHLTHPGAMGYGQSPHQPLQPIQRPMEVAPAAQQYPSKHTAGPGPTSGVLGNGSPQYRAPFPQLSPQLSSPRPQMSPRPQAPQMSPRPVMSPAKPNASPHPQMQQTNLSPRPATSITPKSTTASPAPMPVYSQQSTLQALEQMVMPPASTSNPEYPSYQSRSSLGPPPTLQNPLSPAMVLRNSMMDQQWPPPQHHSRTTHVSNVSGGMGLIDQNLPATQSSVSNLPSVQSLEPVSFSNDDLHSEISNKPSSLPELSTPISQENILSHSITHSITQSDFTPLRSPISTNIHDKPSSTTNTSDISAPNSIHDMPMSHPPTPTPSSTTDDNVINHQESSLPPTSESIKSLEDNSNSSNATQQPSQSQSNITSFTDFTNVSSMTNYTKSIQPLLPTNMDDLMPVSVPVYHQEPLVPVQVSAPNQAIQTTAQPSPSQHTSPHNNIAMLQNQNLTPNQTPPMPISYTQLGQMQPASLIPTAANTQLPPAIQPVHHQTPPPNLPITQLQPSTVPLSQTNTTTVSNQTNITNVTQPIAQTQLTAVSIPPHSQSPNIGIPNIPNITSLPQAPNMYDQNATVMAPNGMPMGVPPRSMPHGIPMGIPTMPMGMTAPPGMVHGMIPNQDMGYQPPITHHQERAALQQQLQELYCMPPAPENQDKISHLQERLNILGQHEANDQCNGGPQCILQSPIFTSPMIDSPQVSSTTGRGRSKGAPRTKKPRQKKGEKDISLMGMMMPSQQLPVSEDCVTAGAGLNIPSSELTELSMDPITDMDLDMQKKPRGARKPREPKKPKEPKPPKEPKIPKERKKREPKEPKEQKVKRKYVRKKKLDIEDSITDDSFNKSAESSEEHIDISQTSQITYPEPEENSIPEPEEIIPETIKEAELVQADSQTPSEEILEPGEIEIDVKKDEYQFDEHSNSNEEIEKMVRKTPKRVKPPAPPKKVVSYKSRSSKTSSSGKSRKRKGQVSISDGEGEDLVTTPPPSPPEDPESAIQKRRSSRHTQRKKYVDDVVLRFSDDESPSAVPRSRKAPVPPVPPASLIVATPVPDISELLEEPNTSNSNIDIGGKPNFVYVNTTEEDSMVVQYVLASRMTKREKRVEIGKEDSKEDGNDALENKDEDFIKNEDNADALIIDKEKEETPTPIDIMDNSKYTTIIADVEEYYVKYRNFSYLHCEWKTEDELFKGDKRIANKIKRFKQKQQLQLNIFEYLDDEPFNPDYIEVDRVLDVAEHVDPNTHETIKHYLVKWRSLQYEDSTWELEEDVDPIKILQFIEFKTLPPRDKWKCKRRQHPDLWAKLEKSPIYKGNNSLREYQLEGLNWLLFSWHNGRNCILADEMGLGKTIQSLTFLHAVHEFGVRGPFLIIAPLSTIPNWQREIEAWTELNVIVYHGSSASRTMLQEYEYYYKNDKGQQVKDLTKFNILITTFEMIVTDVADLKGFNWRVCIIDEAHRLKNRNCKLLEGLRQLNLEHRVLLSGTPLQNNVNELFSLLNFLEPSQFANSEVFLQEFGALKTEQEVQKLQCILKPMMLRRLKEDVEKSLAPKEETVVEVELTNIQKKYYRGILERNFSFLQKGTTQANIPNLMNTMMELRKCCIHPYLLNGAEDQIQYDFKAQHGEDVDAYYKALIHSSGKMVLIDKLLPKLRANGHRVLLFSQMVRCLDILEDYLMYRKYPFERIDGRIRGNLRQAAIDRFSRPDSDRFIFLLCTKAGGLGINLTAADTVIIYDSDWNPQNDLQAQARCHRIGQQKMVKIYRLLCRNTYEREMFDKASLKLGLDKAVLQSMNTSQSGKDSGTRQLSKKEIEDLLKKGAYGALLDEENDGDKFCEEDIDMILARRTQVITMESEKGSTFSKASFASSANRSDIDIDDPDFWNKWAKRADIDTTEKDETEDLVLSEPRRRTQIKRYGHDESAIDMSELETSTDSDPDGEGLPLGLRSRRNKKLKKRLRSDDYIPRDGERGDIVYGSWARRECFMVERGLLTFGWGRWREILDHSQLRKGWKESDIEDCARVILLYCLRFYRGDEKIRSFIWDLITPCEYGEGMQITRNHHGLKDPVPRGIRNKNKKKIKDSRHAALTDPNHWSKNEKYDGDIFLESNYKKHLGRHANKVLLRVRMLYYIKHEIIGDLVQHIADGVHASALPINPPITEQLPCEWWDAECDKSLLVGTWKHGYESYAEMRADPTLCFLSRCGPPSARELQLASNTQPPTPALNDDDLDDDDTNEEYILRPSRHREVSDVNSEIAEPSPGPSASSETQPSVDPDERAFDDLDDRQNWPTATDLNTRLRRVITSYQRSYRKEEQQKLAKVKPASVESALSSPLAALAQVSQQLDVRDAASLAMPGWDLQQLALYLLMERERQGKHMELVAREKERLSIARKWSRREEADFFRVVASYGVNYYRKKKAYDWIKFKQLSKLEKKSDDEITEYYKSFVVMCKRQMGLKIDEDSYDSSIEHISEEKARRTLERLELLARIREEIVTHSKLEDRLKVCLTSADMPDWWVPGKHDKDLLLGVAKHGLGRTDYYILNDPELSFREILRKKVGAKNPESIENKDAIKLESHEDILKFDKNEILVKLEKGEGTLKIEKVNVKKESLDDKYKDSFKKDDTKIEFTLVKSEVDDQMDTNTSLDGEPKNNDTLKSDTVSSIDYKDKIIEDDKDTSGAAQDKNEEQEGEGVDLIKKEDVKADIELVEKKETSTEGDICAKQAAELKAMFPDLEVIQPLSRLSQVDTFVLRDKQGSGALDFSETTVAQLFNNAVKWPREYAIQVRLQHIVYAIETKEWPASKGFSAYANGIGPEFDVPIHEIPNDPPKRETSTPMSLGDSDLMSITPERYRDSINKKRKRHIAIDVETERAKLHALLNSSHGGLPNPLPKPSMHWDNNEDSEDSRRSTPITQSLQPPPAHQQTSRVYGMPYEFKYQAPKTIGQTSVIPSTSSTLAPMDLSSGVSKMNTIPDIPKQSLSTHDLQNEVQDFSLKKQSSVIKPSGNKLDDTLSKLMKRKNCPIEEPVVGKEKKRRKLDEIVLGLSAAKEQMLYPETTKKNTVTPSVTVTPTSAPLTITPPQKPFTITVTSIPSPAPSSRSCSTPNLKTNMPTKDSFSSFLAQAEQQNLLLKKQQQQKSYEAMIADINKAADFTSKIGSYSHEAKVNKWLAEQTAALAEPLSNEYLTPRRRRPRVDPSLLDWKKLTGNENVSVIHRVTNKKLTGPKAPTLKRLGQWLMENPMYDVDPKWAELVKERGNLAYDLQKRFGHNGGISSSSLSMKKNTPGRPPLLSSPTGSTSSVNSSANLPTSLASSLQFPSLSGSGLTSLNSSLLSSLSGLGQFDPKNALFDPKNPLFDSKNPLFDPKNPLLMPFAAGMPNINALNSMAGLGNLGNMNLFANLAGLGLPGLGIDPTLSSESPKPKTSVASSSAGGISSSVDNKVKHKPVDAHTSNKSSVPSTPTGLPTTTPFPFFFPNPSLLYTPLGLGGLNPFALQPGMSAAYDSLAQQCNLLNGNLNPAASPNSSSKSSKSNRSSTATSTTMAATTHSRSPKSSRDSHLQNLILPPDTQLLESISKVAGTLDSNLKYRDRGKDDKQKALDSLRGMLPPDFPTSDKLRTMKDLPSFADFNKLFEASHTGLLPPLPPKKVRNDSFEKINKSNVELLANVAVEEQQRASLLKRTTPETIEPIEETERLQPKEFVEDALPIQPTPSENCFVETNADLELPLASNSVPRPPSLPLEINETQEVPMETEPIIEQSSVLEQPIDPIELTPKKAIKRTRGKRKSGEILLDPESVIEKKNLRSSASRSAAVAAARAAKLLEQENALKNQESGECG